MSLFVQPRYMHWDEMAGAVRLLQVLNSNNSRNIASDYGSLDEYNDQNTTNATSVADNDDNVPSTYSYLTDAQEGVIAFLPLFPAFLSVVCSLFIIRLVLLTPSKGPYHRILFGMSVYDISNSITGCLQSFLVPAETSRRLYAIGNDATCQAMGFMFQFNTPSYMYFGALSIYYVSVVKFNMTDGSFSRKLEPWLHAIIILYPTCSAILGLATNLYGELELGAGCWISQTAAHDRCDAECMANRSLLLGGLPFAIVLVVVLVNNLLIYCHVRITVYRVTRRGASLTPESQEAKVRAVGTQALLYCLVFLMTYMWTLILRFASNEEENGPSQEPKVFPIMVLRAIFLPSMGFGTLLCYIRPRYLTMKKTPPFCDMTNWWVLKQLLLNPDPTNPSRHSHIRSFSIHQNRSHVVTSSLSSSHNNRPAGLRGILRRSRPSSRNISSTREVAADVELQGEQNLAEDEDPTPSSGTFDESRAQVDHNCILSKSIIDDNVPSKGSAINDEIEEQSAGKFECSNASRTNVENLQNI